MAMDLHVINSWLWIVIGLVTAFIVLRYFFHVVVHLFQVVMSFFWHGCITLIVLFVLYFILRAAHLL
jgi:hypothetical protein